jgi:spectinomycin phosphotransferase
MCLQAHYAIEVETLTPLSGGADRNATLYQAQTRDQISYFVKLKHGETLGASILELLHDAGVQQIIPPLKTIHGRSQLQMDSFSLIVYPFIEGVNGFSHKLTDAQWIALGKALRQVHDLVVPPSLLKHIRYETYSTKWREMVRTLDAHIQREPSPKDTLSLKFNTFMKEHRAIIQRLVKRAEELANDVKNQPAKFVLCHSDIHGGNVLINSALYIVDWDDPIMAPKERDLMFIGGGVANVWNDPHEAISFYKGYGSTTIDPVLLAYYRHERIVEDIAEYAEALLLTKPESVRQNREEMYRQFVAMFDPNGVVAIAFKSDKECL